MKWVGGKSKSFNIDIIIELIISSVSLFVLVTLPCCYLQSITFTELYLPVLVLMIV